MKHLLTASAFMFALGTTNCQAQQPATDALYHSTQSFFQKALNSSDQYTEFMYSLLSTPSVKEQVSGTYAGDGQEGKKLKHLYARDLCRSMLEMGHDVDFLNNVEGMPLIIQFFHDEGGTKNSIRLNFGNIANTKTYLKAETEWLLTLRDKNKIARGDETLCLAKTLLEADRADLCKEYYLKLKSFCSVIANADNHVSADETAWLNKLATLSNEVAAVRNSTSQTSTAASSNDPNDPFVRLDELIGLDEVKEKVRTLANTVKIQKMKEKRGMKTQSMSYHCIFLGNPGTGKTTVARILADIYRNLGVVRKGHLVETDRSGLIGSYVGQTAPKVNHMCDSALNGILFIDEAYAITQGSGNDYGKEAVATLLKRMEDDRDKLVVILAGYSKEMGDFLEANSGLKSRINNYINFPDYTASELFKIYLQNVKRNDCILDKQAEGTVKNYINDAVAHKDAYFGNARFVRNFVEKSLEEQANRLSSFTGDITDAMLRQITKSDVEHAIEAMKNNK